MKPRFLIYFRDGKHYMVARNIEAYRIAPIYEYESKPSYDVHEEWQIDSVFSNGTTFNAWVSE